MKFKSLLLGGFMVTLINGLGCGWVKQAPGGGAAWTPDDLSGVKLLRLKASSLSLSNNDPVASWTDSYGVANAATAASTDRPTYKTGGANGKPYVDFDGNDFLAIASFTKPTYFSWLAVLEMSAIGLLLEHNGPAGSNNDSMYVGAINSDNAMFIRRASSNTTRINGASNWMGTALVQVMGTYDGTTPRVYKGGTEQTLGGVSGSGHTNGTSTAQLAIGARALSSENFNCTGKLYELILVEGVLTASDRANWATYVLSEYGI